MAKRKKRKEKEKKQIPFIKLITGLILIVVSLFSLIPNTFGLVGKLLNSTLSMLFGNVMILFVLFILYLGIYLVINRKRPNLKSITLFGLYLMFFSVLIIVHMISFKDGVTSSLLIKNASDIYKHNISNAFTAKNIIVSKNGIIGIFLANLSKILISEIGSYILFSLTFIIGFIFLTGYDLFEVIKNKVKKEDEEEDFVVLDKPKKKKERVKEKVEEELVVTSISDLENLDSIKEEIKEPKVVTSLEFKDYKLPPINLLNNPKKSKAISKKVVDRNIETLEQVLFDFGINAKTVHVTSGPAVTQYELELEAGTKVNKLLSLNKEISLALAKKDVRIVAPIPGKSTVGIELANDYINPVSFKEMMEVLPEDKKDNPLLVVLGKNINGEPIFCEIDKTPHLLVAGATGSGKSVCINGIISTLIMRTTPDQVQLVLIDPKKVEFAMYNDMPHLLTPVVTDPKKANVALQKIVREMENRYDLFSKEGVKNIAGYNELVERKNKTRGEDGKLTKMKYIVAIIDELADLMLVASKEVEDSIMRITQMARAAGIHLIVATQRPSTDIITGVVKANIPSRISFAVSSSIDSRTILDQTGAEKLLGRGDMLFLPMGENSPTRVQGSFVSDQEVERLVSYVKKQVKEPNYSEEFSDLSITETVEDADNVDNDDPLYNEVYDFVKYNKTISTSKLQRKYKIGFNRASNLMDLLEERGVVGPSVGTKPREVLVYEEN